MSNARATFSFEGKEIKIQCFNEDKMKDICQKFANKIKKNLNSLLFIYGGDYINFDLSFKEQASIVDKERNEMSILAYKNEGEENYIIAKIGIKDEDVNKEIKIINSYENFIRENPGKLEEDDIFKNEDEIKNVEIQINDELIPFNYCYKFTKKGKYTIKYTFKNNLKSACLMFGDCELLLNINLSNFNTNNLTNMVCMFYGCSSLSYINLSNLNTINVTDTNGMFYECSSLTIIDLSNLDTTNVTDMCSMF